eukprot:5345860-Pleurochrysis_carterae.AAC.1
MCRSRAHAPYARWRRRACACACSGRPASIVDGHVRARETRASRTQTPHVGRRASQRGGRAGVRASRRRWDECEDARKRSATRVRMAPRACVRERGFVVRERESRVAAALALRASSAPGPSWYSSSRHMT